LRALLDQWCVREVPPLQRIVVAVDPPVSSGRRADACCIVATGITDGGMVYVIADDTVSGATRANKPIAPWRKLDSSGSKCWPSAAAAADRRDRGRQQETGRPGAIRRSAVH
jgi:phage terminase large subunit-like protein